MNTKKRRGRCSHQPAVRIVSLILVFVMLFTITAGLDFSAFAASCNHNMPVGNSGKWFNSKSEVKSYASAVMKDWAARKESGEITRVEYIEGCPQGYEAWACYKCGMFTVNFYYDEITCKHKWTKETTVAEPTCLDDGYRERYCTICNIWDRRNLPALGHNIIKTGTDATLTSEGYVHMECSNCGFVFGDYTTPKMVSMSELPFTDLNSFSTYSGYVAYTSVYNKFITGTNPPERTLFSPTTSISRAMFVTILYRMAGEPYKNGGNPYKTSPFTDIKDKGVYYYDAACWALDNEITNQKMFKPYDNVTRQQTAAFLFRYAQANNLIKDDAYLDIDLSQYPDYDPHTYIIDGKPAADHYPGVAEWAKEPLQWANYNGMITGTKQGYINPLGATQRIHATKILYGFGKVCNIGNFA